MIKNRFFRKAFVCSAIVGFAASIASCNLGFMESEDSDLAAYLEESTTAAFSGSYKAKASGEVTLTLSNGSFSTALKTAVASASSTSTVDVSDYFDLTLIDDSGTDVTSTVVKSQTITALSAVTSTAGTTSGTTSFTPDTESLSVKIVIKMQDSGSSDSVSGKLYVTATGDATASGSSLTCLETTLSTFEITTAVVALQAASTAQLYTAGQTSAAIGKGVAVLSLGGITSQAVSKGDAVATGSIGTDTSVTAYALAACEEEASEIPVYIDSDVYTGAVSLTVDSDIISDTTITATNCSNIKVVYYGLDFSSYDSSSESATDYINSPGGYTTVVKSGAYSTESDSKSDFGNYVASTQGGAGPRLWSTKSSKIALSNIDSTDDYIIEFDAALGPGNNTGSAASPTHQFAIVSSTFNTSPSTATAITDNYLLCMTCDEVNGADAQASFTWTVNDADSSEVSLQEWTFYHYKLVKTSSAVKLTITSSDGATTLLDAATLTTTTTDTPAAFALYAVRGGRGSILMDNILAYQACE
ncbi:MAG: hypothetical protein K6F69_01490 [Treponema sp.]|nr:hypothetical protein [Treponema sp.]